MNTTENNPEFWCSTWGWEQTNVDFYMVVRKTAASVWLQKVCHGERKDAGAFMQTYCTPSTTPVPGSEVIRRKRKQFNYGGKVEEYAKIESYSLASPWNGKPVLETSYA